MNILLTGANGFLGQVLCRQLIAKGWNLTATGKGPSRIPDPGDNYVYVEMDFTDPFQVHDVFDKYKPSVVIHAGAITQADQCEQEQWQAYLVNVEGVVNMLLNAEEQQSFFIFISTDFVFDGAGEMYSEEDEPRPVNFYGRTKMEAEDAVKEYEHHWAIVRTSLVYGGKTNSRGNIVSIVKEKLEKAETYKVVDDQFRTPTYVEDLASGIIQIITRKATGIYHLSGSEVLTPWQLAKMVAIESGYDDSNLIRVTAADFSQPARRPANTSLNIQKAVKVLEYAPRSFTTALRLVLGTNENK